MSNLRKMDNQGSKSQSFDIILMIAYPIHIQEVPHYTTCHYSVTRSKPAINECGSPKCIPTISCDLDSDGIVSRYKLLLPRRGYRSASGCAAIKPSKAISFHFSLHRTEVLADSDIIVVEVSAHLQAQIRGRR